LRRVVPGVLVAAAVALASIAIAAVETRRFGSPFVRVNADDVAASIAGTAILGVISCSRLGPVSLFFSVCRRDRFAHAPSLTTLVPWFIVGFLALARLRATGAVPAS
jgi:uncharacterized membrane protein YadS